MIRRCYFKWGLLVVAAVLIIPAVALSFEFTPSVAVKGEYNDNILFSESDEKDDYVTTISPRIEVAGRTERYMLKISAGGDGVIYQDNDDLNNMDQKYSVDLSYALTQRLNLGFGASYLVDSRPDREIAQTGLLYGTDERYKQDYAGSLGYVLTERTSVNLSYSFEKQDFDDDQSRNFEGHNIKIGILYNLGRYLPTYFLRTNVGFLRNEYVGSNIEGYSADIGLSGRLTEKAGVSFSIGARQSSSEFETSKIESDRWGMIGSLTLNYAGERSNISLTFSHDLTSATAFSGSTERTGASLSAGADFSEKFKGGINAGFYINRSDAAEYSESEVDDRTINIEPYLSYNLLDDLVISAGYRFRSVNDRIDSTEKKNSLFYLKMMLAHTFGKR